MYFWLIIKFITMISIIKKLRDGAALTNYFISKGTFI